MKNILLLSVLLFLIISLYSQKIKEGEYIIEIKEYEVIEQESSFLGKQKTIIGIFEVKKDKKLVGVHQFIAPLISESMLKTVSDSALTETDLARVGQISHIAVLDGQSQKLLPRLHYVVESKSFTYYEDTEAEGEEKAAKTGEQEEIILSGLLIWARLTYNKNIH